jgi:hypothetical protein
MARDDHTSRRKRFYRELGFALDEIAALLVRTAKPKGGRHR